MKMTNSHLPNLYIDGSIESEPDSPWVNPPGEVFLLHLWPTDDSKYPGIGAHLDVEECKNLFQNIQKFLDRH
jgi:hypothetical protein